MPASGADPTGGNVFALGRSSQSRDTCQPLVVSKPSGAFTDGAEDAPEPDEEPSPLPSLSPASLPQAASSPAATATAIALLTFLNAPLLQPRGDAWTAVPPPATLKIGKATRGYSSPLEQGFTRCRGTGERRRKPSGRKAGLLADGVPAGPRVRKKPGRDAVP